MNTTLHISEIIENFRDDQDVMPSTRAQYYTAARVLDHIKPINPKDAYNTAGGRYGEPLSPDNVQWLCDTHHAKKSGAEHLFHNG